MSRSASAIRRASASRTIYAFVMLGYDILQLAALLYLTGGLENPFAFLLIAPVTVSASTLPLAITAALGALAIVAATLLTSFHHPLPWFHHSEFAAALPLCDGHVGGAGVRHPVHRLLFLAHGGGSAAHGRGAGRGRDRARARAETVGARRARRRGGAWARHAACDHRRRHQGADARRQADRPALRRRGPACARRPSAAATSWPSSPARGEQNDFIVSRLP